MYEKLTIVGHLGKDPELRFTKSGNPMCFFSMATSRKYKNKAGKTISETTWWNVTVFGPQAESANQYLYKGDPVLVEGRIRSDQEEGNQGNPRMYARKDGSTGTSYEVTAEDVRFMPGGQGQERGPKSPGYGRSDQSDPDYGSNYGEDGDWDPPF